MSSSSFFNNRLVIKVGDITNEKCDAIVNAANSSLMGGAGVDRAIHRAGGPKILEECREIRKKLPGGLPSGQAVLTTGGNLPAQHVIHTVGPVWQGGSSSEAEKLAESYKSSLDIAVKHQLKTIAFPSISTGVFGYPLDKAAQMVSKTIKEYLSQNDYIEKVILVFFQQKDKDIFLKNATLK